MSSDEHWKEQLGFISGTALVGGTLLFSLWPTVATFQTGLNVHFWTVVTPGENPKPGFTAYQALTVPLALGISAVFFSILHLLSRGLWLGLTQSEEHNVLVDRTSNVLNRLAYKSYVAVFIQWFFSALALLVGGLFLLGNAIELIIRKYFVSGSTLPRLIVAFIVSSPLLLSAIYLALRSLKKKSKSKTAGESEKVVRASLPISLKELGIYFILFYLVWAASIELCYTASLRTEKRMAIRSQDKYIEALVSLGGATSDADLAKLELRDLATDAVQELKMVPLGDGQFASYVKVDDLREGTYRLELTYPHISLSSSYPYISSRVERHSPLILNP